MNNYQYDQRLQTTGHGSSDLGIHPTTNFVDFVICGGSMTANQISPQMRPDIFLFILWAIEAIDLTHFIADAYYHTQTAYIFDTC
jgi:hypothetical protein